MPVEERLIHEGKMKQKRRQLVADKENEQYRSNKVPSLKRIKRNKSSASHHPPEIIKHSKGENKFLRF